MDYTYQIRLRRGTSSQWSISNPILASGEPGLATDLNYYKIGDGVTPWNDLPWTTGLKGDSASVTAGETITGAPGSSADVTNSGTELNAIFDFVIPEGMPGKDLVVHEGDRDDPPSDWTNQQFLWDPNGEIHEEVPLTEAETDARYISKSLLTAKGDLMARDASTTVRVPVGQDGQLLTADSSALQGMAWKPNEAYSKAVSDARYEKKLLTQAVAWYDAGVLTDDGTALRDLTGNGRDAVFGAGDAAPLVLPWDGEDYIAFQNQTVIEYVGVCVYVASTATTVWEFDLDTSFSVNCHVFASDSYYHGGFTYNVDLTSSIRYRGVTAVFGYRNPMRRHRLRLEYRPDGWAVHVDGEQVGSGSWTATAHGYSGICTVGNNATSQRYNLYSAVLEQDGSATWRIDPRNVSADYSKIANTGTAGGDWTILRATSGFKAAVVDRPLVLFGGGQSMVAAGVPAGTLLRACRAFGTGGGTIGAVQSAHPGGTLTVSGTTEEFIAAAIFDRALTDAEVAKATQELLGVPHTEQPDPHPQYLRQRVTRPNIDDLLVETWDGTKWVMTHYDSGIRNVSGLLLNGWTGLAQLRRINGTVRLWLSGLKDGTAPQYLNLTTLPAGFGIISYAVMHYRNGSTGAITTGRAGSVESALPAAGQAVTAELMYIPDNVAVPTSLPGTLFTPAP